MITEKIKEVNRKALGANVAFLTMGVTASLIGSHFLISHLIGPVIIGSTALRLMMELINKNNITKEQYLGLGPTLYRADVKKHIIKYIDNSKNETEKFYKSFFIFDDFRLNKASIETWAGTDYKNFLSDYKVIKGILPYTPLGLNKIEKWFQYINVKEMPENLEQAHEVLKDFKDVGFLGKTLLTDLENNIYLKIQDWKLTDIDMRELSKVTDINFSISSDFIFKIMKKNPQHITKLTQIFAEKLIKQELLTEITEYAERLSLSNTLENSLPVVKINKRNKI